MKAIHQKAPLAILTEADVAAPAVKTENGPPTKLAPLIPPGTVKKSADSPEEIAHKVDTCLPPSSEVQRFVFATFQQLLSASEARAPMQAHNRDEINRLWDVALAAGEKMIQNYRKPCGLLDTVRERQIRLKTHFEG